MLKGIGWPELIIVLVIVVLIFGVGRIGKISKEIGTGIRSFKEGLKEDEDKEESDPEKKE